MMASEKLLETHDGGGTSGVVLGVRGAAYDVDALASLAQETVELGGVGAAAVPLRTRASAFEET